MKVFLFLYPFDAYFAKWKEIYKIKFDACGYDVLRINDIINARYRQRGYMIYWLMLGTDKNPREPDLSLLSKDISINEQDRILVAEIPFKKLTNEEIYPDPASILAQIPEITELVLGGFHQWDCVDKLAQYAHEKGISVLVDEDTTDMFFSRTSLQGTIPLIRKNPFQLLKPEDSRRAGEARKGKPWFPPI